MHKNIERALDIQHPGWRRRVKPKRPCRNSQIYSARILFVERGKTIPRSNGEPVEIWLPDLVLPSVNRMVKSKKREFQATAKHKAISAVLHAAERCHLRSFVGAVECLVEQRLTSINGHSVDVFNFYDKHVIDCLSRKKGLGIIEDDDPVHVPRVIRQTVKAEKTGVYIRITPMGTTQQEVEIMK